MWRLFRFGLCLYFRIKSAMTPVNILSVTDRDGFRTWLYENHSAQKECWVRLKRGKTPPAGILWYLDAVEEALCFGWIDSTLKTIDGALCQRFSPRTKSGRWTELNKERCRRLEAIGLMTESGRRACPNLEAEFVIDPDVTDEFAAHPVAWANFQSFHPLYQRVRIDNIQSFKDRRDIFEKRLAKLIAASEKGVMIGDWNDFGRLL